MNQSTSAAAKPQREIPPIPGGGSWRFDEARWGWVSNDAAPAKQPVAAAAAAPIDAPAAKQPATEE